MDGSSRTRSSTVDEALTSVALYQQPKLQERGLYQLRPECWSEFDPHFFTHFTRADMEQALRRASASRHWDPTTPLTPPLVLPPPLHQLPMLLRCPTVLALVRCVPHTAHLLS